MKNKHLLALNIVLASIPFFASIYFLIKYLSSFYQEDYGDSVSIDFDRTYLVLLIGCVAILAYFIYRAVTLYKGTYKMMSKYSVLAVISMLAFCYPLGVFIRAMAKGKEFADNQFYLYFSIMGLILIVYSLLSYRFDKKALKESKEDKEQENN